jgi:magnesium chelatase accessory protein
MTHWPDWEREGKDWPNRHCSRFVEAGGVRWHVQRMGQGPCVLLIHGTGAATHSWRDVMPLLAREHTVIAVDLPGHGFSRPLDKDPAPFTLPGMASALGQLLECLKERPALVVGHSAGAAVGARLCLDDWVCPRTLISLNGVMLPFPGAVTLLFSNTARLLSMMPMLPQMVAWRATDRRAVEDLLRGTGSTVDPTGTEFYGRLIRHPGHVSGVLKMMNHWDLQPLARDLAGLPVDLAQIVGDRDRMVPLSEALRVQALVPGSSLLRLPGLGHLAHEERPSLLAQQVARHGGSGASGLS